MKWCLQVWVNSTKATQPKCCAQISKSQRQVQKGLPRFTLVDRQPAFINMYRHFGMLAMQLFCVYAKWISTDLLKSTQRGPVSVFHSFNPSPYSSHGAGIRSFYFYEEASSSTRSTVYINRSLRNVQLISFLRDVLETCLFYFN